MTEEQKPAIPAEESVVETPVTEDLLGYESLEAMKQGVLESRKEGKRLSEVNQALTAQLAALVRQATSGNAGAVKSALDEINDLGIDKETFVRAVKDVARGELSAELTPMHKTQEAVATLRADHPTFAKSEGDFNKWLVANPDVAEEYNMAVTKNPASAKRLLMGVYAEYETTRKSKPAEPTKVPAGAKLTGGSGSPTQGRKPSDQPTMSEDDFVKAVKRARSTGDVVSLIRAMKGDKPIHRDFAQKD